jgi:ubiquinone/menaquinone biosynthesis C-methylase UbiE
LENGYIFEDDMSDSATSLGEDGAGPGIRAVEAYWDAHPCNIRHSPKPVNSREYFDEVEQRKHFVEPHIPSFAQFARWAGKRVLEVGCGIGTAAVNFARYGADYTGVDLSKMSLDLTRRRFEVYELKGRLIHGNAEELSRYVENNCFDFVYSFGVIHHSPNQRAIVEQIRKVIRDDGEFRCMLYAKNSLKDIMIEAGLDQPEAQQGCPFATTYTHETLRELYKDLFEVVGVTQAHIFPYVVEKYLNYEYELQPWFKAMPPQMFTALERRLGWHMLIVGQPINPMPIEKYAKRR